MAGVFIFGGTFDPIHLGHLRSAWEVSQQLSLESMHFIPSASPVHRAQPVATAAHRLAMVQLAVESIPGWVANDIELRRATPSYTVDTLISLRESLGYEVPFWFLMGSDAFEGLLSWHRWQDMMKLTNLAIMVRAGTHPQCCEELQAMLDSNEHAACHYGQARLIEVTPLAIAATRIRADLASKQLPHFLVSESVLEYIQNHKIYEDKG